jgi:hypothetical protein
VKVYSASGWINAGSAVNGTSERFVYVVGTVNGLYTGSTTVFPATYDAGYVDVYVEGIKLINGVDYTATNGTDITISAALTVGLDVEIIGYGVFSLTNAAQIKTMYESNANTNVFTDAEATKVSNITVTQAVDLDQIESDTATNNAKVTNVSTDLGYIASAIGGTVTSSDGSDATIPLAVLAGNAGLMTGTDKTAVAASKFVTDKTIVSAITSVTFNADGSMTVVTP